MTSRNYRCGQPLVGIQGRRSEADENMIQAARLCRFLLRIDELCMVSLILYLCLVETAMSCIFLMLEVILRLAATS